jgi:GWxTD domain-containing protein
LKGFTNNCRLWFCALLFCALFSINAQPIAYFNMGAFNVPQQQAFLETYLTIVGNSLKMKKTGSGFQNAVNISLVISKDSTIIKANKYNLSGPNFTDSLKIPAFIDNQRYPLANGSYSLEMIVRDLNDPKQKPLVFFQRFNISFGNKLIEGSSIEVLESYTKSNKPSSISKSGVDLIPYNVNYFPETQNELSFYFETYNTDTVLGTGKTFLFTYYVENSETLKKLENYGTFKKQSAAKVNPLLGKIDISKLGTGNYNLVIEVKDQNNITQFQTKYFFQRLNKAVDMVALFEWSKKKNVSEYFGACENLDTLKMFVECLWPIAATADKERVINISIKKDKEIMKKFVINFWERRAGDSANALKLWADYYKDVQVVMANFRCGKQAGYYTERGRVYLQYGPPSQRSQQNFDLNTWPYEIWQYYKLTDRTNGQFFSNRKFVFVNNNIADDCHRLVHSNMTGEIQNDRWAFDVTKRNYNGIGNPDQNSPTGAQNNQFDEIYNNPR